EALEAAGRAGLQHDPGALDVGAVEQPRGGLTAGHVRLGGVVDDDLRAVGVEGGSDLGFGSDIGAPEAVVGIGRDVVEAAEITRVGQLVEIDDQGRSPRQATADEVAAQESRATRHQDRLAVHLADDTASGGIAGLQSFPDRANLTAVTRSDGLVRTRFSTLPLRPRVAESFSLTTTIGMPLRASLPARTTAMALPWSGSRVRSMRTRSGSRRGICL